MDYYHTSSFETDIDNRHQELVNIPNDMFDRITSPSLYFDTTHTPARLPPSISSTSSYSTNSSESPIDMPEEYNQDHSLFWPTFHFQGPSYLHFHAPFSEATEDTTTTSPEGIIPSHVFSASDLQEAMSSLTLIDSSEYLTNMPDFGSETAPTLTSPFQQPSYFNFQQPFSEPSEATIATGPVSQEGIPPSHVFSAPQPHLDLQQQAGPLRRFPCEDCGRSFATRWNLKIHKDLHDPNRVKPHACPNEGCHYASARKNDLKRHMGSCSST